MRGPTIALSILAAALSAGAMVPRANAPTSQHLARAAPLSGRAPLAAQAHGLSKRQDDTDDADDADALAGTEDATTAVLDDAVADDGLRKRQDDTDDGTDDTDPAEVAPGIDTTEAEDVVEDDLAEAAAPEADTVPVAEDIAEVPAVPAAPVAAPAAPVAADAAASPATGAAFKARGVWGRAFP